MPSWSPGGDFGSPTYTKPIKVVDGVKSTFIGERRRRWRLSLDRALAWWQLPFALTYRAESAQPYVADDFTVSQLNSDVIIIPNAIALIRMHSDVAGDSAAWNPDRGGGICLLTPWRGWWNGKAGMLQISSVAAHEIGHALGFGHGGTGVMMGAGRPNDEERRLAATYYGV